MNGDDLDHLWAKSPEKDRSGDLTLVAHLLATLRSGWQVRDRVGSVPGMPAWFWRCALLAMLCHDAGKVAALFQQMLRAGRDRTLAWGERHEVLSLGFLPTILGDLSDAERRMVAFGVATHHRALIPARSRTASAEDHRRKPKDTLSRLYRNAPIDKLITRMGPVDRDSATRLASWLAATAAAHDLIHPARRPLPEPDGLIASAHDELLTLFNHRFDKVSGRAAVLLQGAVTLADHLASANVDLHNHQVLGAGTHDVVEAAVTAKDGTLAGFQLAAALHDGHLLVRAPTGGGKTEAALLWAARQVRSIIERAGGVPRVFYTLPYLASINAMAVRLGTLFRDDVIGVSHSRSGSFHLSRAVADLNDEDDGSGRITAAQKAVSRAAATRLFRETFRVGTPYQLLRGALAGPAHSSALLDAANSVFILDELHAYDPARLGIILAGLRFWESLGGRIGVVSATTPAALVELLNETLVEPLTVLDAPRHSWPIRHRLHTSTDHLTSTPSVDAIRTRLDSGQSVLVVANNVADAQALFTELAPHATDLFGEDAATLLHSRFGRRDRQAIEARVRERYGTGPARQPGLLVGTQAVEVSLDVDFDAIHTSGAPLDALLQRFGRVNRRGIRGPADVVVHEPDYRERRGAPGLFADAVYEETPTRHTLDILTAHDGALLSEADVADWLDEIYAGPWGEQWRDEVRQRRDQFTAGFFTFTHPFDDRSSLEAAYDEHFNGSEAVLADDLEEYRELLASARGRAGRLLADDLLIPLPSPGRYRIRWDKRAEVRYVDADYDTATGLGALRGSDAPTYRAGEVI